MIDASSLRRRLLRLVGGRDALERSACSGHRARLLRYVAWGERDPELPDALDHRSGCDECERELADAATVVATLRRLASEAHDAEPFLAPADGWERLRARLQAERRASRARRAARAGILASSIVAVALIGPAVMLDPWLSTGGRATSSEGAEPVRVPVTPASTDGNAAPIPASRGQSRPASRSLDTVRDAAPAALAAIVYVPAAGGTQDPSARLVVVGPR